MRREAIRVCGLGESYVPIYVSAYGDDGDLGALVIISIYLGSSIYPLRLNEFQAAKLSQELFESVKAIADSRTVSPAPTIEEVEA